MRTPVDRTTLDRLLHHAAFAAHLVGHLNVDAALIGQLREHIDAIAHGLTKILGKPSPLAAPAAAALDDHAASMLAFGAGGAR